MKHLKACLAFAAALSLVSTTVPAKAEPLKNIVLVHGAWVDASGWKPVYEILTKEGFHVSMVQEPETSFAEDVTAAKRVLDLQDGPTLLVGHSYGGSIITEAGVHPKVAGLVYVAAHAPDVGEDEAALGKKTPSVLAKTEGAIKVTPDKFTYLDPVQFPKLFAPDLPRERAEFVARSQVLAAAQVFSTPLTAAAWKTKPSWGIVAGSDQIINPDLERWYYERAKSHTTVIPGASHSVYEFARQGSRGRHHPRRPHRPANDGDGPLNTHELTHRVWRTCLTAFPPDVSQSARSGYFHMLMSTNAEIKNRTVTTWQRHREARDARIEAGSRLARGKIVEARDATRLMEAVIRPGDRVCLEGDNQKQADLLSSALLAVDLAKVQ